MKFSGCRSWKVKSQKRRGIKAWSHSKSFSIPISVDSIAFDSIKLKLKASNPSIRINNLTLDINLNGNSKFYKENEYFIFEFGSKNTTEINRKKTILYISATSSKTIKSSKLIELEEYSFFHIKDRINPKLITLKSRMLHSETKSPVYIYFIL